MQQVPHFSTANPRTFQPTFTDVKAGLNDA